MGRFAGYGTRTRLVALCAVLLLVWQSSSAMAGKDDGSQVMVLDYRAAGAATPPLKVGGATEQSLILKSDVRAKPEPAGDLTLYKTDGRSVASLLARLKQDAGTKEVAAYRPIGPVVYTKSLEKPGPGMKTCDLIVLSNPIAGHEDGYKHWYEDEHIPDALKMPGFESAQRFVLLPEASVGNFAFPRYAVRFVFHSSDVPTAAAEFKRRLDAGIIKRSPDFDYGTAVSRYYVRAN
jgi:hypothetical protein